MLVSIMRYYNNAATFVFIVFSWRFFKIFLVDVESIITLKGRKRKREGIGDRRKKTLPPFPFRAFLPLPHPLPTSFCACHASYLDSNYVQASHKLLDPKFKTLARLFPKQQFFFQTQGYQIGDQYTFFLKKTTGTKLFSWCAANVRARLNKI